MTHEQFCKHLENSGWRKYRQLDNEIWCKRFKDAVRCKCNDGKEGIQAVITVYNSAGLKEYSYEADITGEKKDGTWVKLCAYGFDRNNLADSIDSQVGQLLKTWNFIASL